MRCTSAPANGDGLAERGTADLLLDAAASLGFVATVSVVDQHHGRTCARHFELRNATRSYALTWPPIEPIHKSTIPRIADGSKAIRAVETRDICNLTEPPWLPCCLKPDDGSLGEGFVAVRRREDWKPALHAIGDRRYVVQPLLFGTEYRVTACWNGQYAVARLDGRNGRWSLWADATAVFPPAWVRDLIRIARRFDAPGLGCDVLVAGEQPHVLDINAAPNLAIHLLTGSPRDVARAYLGAWLAMCDAKTGNARASL